MIRVRERVRIIVKVGLGLGLEVGFWFGLDPVRVSFSDNVRG